MGRPARSSRRPDRRPRRAAGGGGWRAALAGACVVLVAAGVVWLVSCPTRRPKVPDERRARAAAAVVRQVAARSGLPADAVSEEAVVGARGTLQAITVRVRSGFAVRPFVLALEAEFHNRGGRLTAGPLAESGGYGLARLDGELEGGAVRIVVLGDRAAAERRTPHPPRPTRTATALRPRLAIVLDDAGNSLEAVHEVERLPRAIAVAVLPNAANSRAVARGLAAQGREVLLHMPMEPLGGNGPGAGPGAIEVGLSSGEIARRLRAALDVVAEARGMNNHMGSRATADVAAMTAVMAVLRPAGLYFLDSRTTPDTVAEQVAIEAGVPALRRDVFLDVVTEPEAIRAALGAAVERARGQGSAVAIGHVHAVTIGALAEDLTAALGDVALVAPSDLVSSR